jgi:hypothetical protein
MNGNDMEGSGGGLIERNCLSIRLEELRKTTKTSFMIAGFRTEI